MNISDLTVAPKIHKVIEDYVSFIKANHRLDGVYSYYKSNNLHKYKNTAYKFDHPTQYCYIFHNIVKNKYYIGETLDCFRRIDEYFSKAIHNISLKEDMLFQDMKDFQYYLITCEDGVYMQNKKIQDALRKGFNLYNIQKADPLKSKKKTIKAISNKKIIKDIEFKGFTDLWDSIG